MESFRELKYFWESFSGREIAAHGGGKDGMDAAMRKRTRERGVLA